MGDFSTKVGKVISGQERRDGGLPDLKSLVAPSFEFGGAPEQVRPKKPAPKKTPAKPAPAPTEPKISPEEEARIRREKEERERLAKEAAEREARERRIKETTSEVSRIPTAIPEKQFLLRSETDVQTVRPLKSGKFSPVIDMILRLDLIGYTVSYDKQRNQLVVFRPVATDPNSTEIGKRQAAVVPFDFSALDKNGNHRGRIAVAAELAAILEGAIQDGAGIVAGARPAGTVRSGVATDNHSSVAAPIGVGVGSAVIGSSVIDRKIGQGMKKGFGWIRGKVTGEEPEPELTNISLTAGEKRYELSGREFAAITQQLKRAIDLKYEVSYDGNELQILIPQDKGDPRLRTVPFDANRARELTFRQRLDLGAALQQAIDEGREEKPARGS